MAERNGDGKDGGGKSLGEDFFVGTRERDAVSIVRDASKVQLPKRFYQHATVEERDGDFAVLLDGRGVRTPRQTPVALPTRAAAERAAAEWAAQGEIIDPADMPFTRLVNSALDGVAADVGAVARDIVKYSGSDLLCYRAAEPPALVAAQADAWDPVLAWADEKLGARFRVAEGVVFVDQPSDAIDAVAREVTRIAAGDHAALRIAALHVLTTLSGSTLLALAIQSRALSRGEAWAAAHVDEDEQMRVWGFDAEALRRRAAREREFVAAAGLLETLR